MGGITASPFDDNIMQWDAVIFGPDDSPWEGGTFKLTLAFTEDYPNMAPKVKFITKMFHPNIYADGSICLDILQHNWSPIYDIAAILTSIQSLLTDPNPNSPANVEAAKLYQENRREYEKRVALVVEQSWDEDDDDDDDDDEDSDDDSDEDDEDEDEDEDEDMAEKKEDDNKNDKNNNNNDNDNDDNQ